jgi:hypothetical protein
MTRKRSSIAATRSALYDAAKLLGDVRAVQTGKIGPRLVRRLVGRGTARLLGKLFR